MCGVMMEMESLDSSGWLLALLRAELSIEMLSSNREEGVDEQGDTDKADAELLGEADKLILRLFCP